MGALLEGWAAAGRRAFPGAASKGQSQGFPYIVEGMVGPDSSYCQPRSGTGLCVVC